MVPRPRGTQCEHSDETRGARAMQRQSRRGRGITAYLKPHSNPKNDVTRSSWRGHQARSGTAEVCHPPSSCNTKRSEPIALMFPAHRGFDSAARPCNALRTPRHLQHPGISRLQNILDRSWDPCVRKRADSAAALSHPMTRSMPSGVSPTYATRWSSRAPHC